MHASWTLTNMHRICVLCCNLLRRQLPS